MNRFDFKPVDDLENEELNTNNNSNPADDELEPDIVESFNESEEEFNDTSDDLQTKDYIERDSAFEEESSLMDSLLSDADDLGNDYGLDLGDDLSTSLEEEENKEESFTYSQDFESDESSDSDGSSLEDEPFKDESFNEDEYIDEPFKDENDYEGEIEEPYQYSEDEGEADFDDSNNYYNDAEISSRRKKGKSSNLGLKIVVGVVAIGVIVGAAVGIRYLMNNGDKLFKKSNEETQIEQPIETTTPSIETTPTVDETSKDTETSSTQSIDVETEKKDEVKEEDNSTEVSSFLQNFTGYVVDINNKEIYVSDKLTSEQETLLKNDFDSYISDTDITVYITENQYNELKGITNQEETTTDGPIIIGGDTNTQTEQSTSSSEDKYYHFSGDCETMGLIGMHAIKLSELNNDFAPCPDCGNNIGSASKNAIDYDYSLNPELATIIYKKFNIDAESLPVWTTIGSKITISYIQNEETLLNDVIEVSRAKSNQATESSTVDGTSDSSVDDLDDYRLSDTSIFGSEFDAIVATINDRRKNETKRTGNVLDDELSLAGESTKDSVSTKLQIGACEYVWIQIVWKKNSDTPSVPDVDDVTVELQTPSGSLINESNIDGYGKKWVDKKVINYVLKNPKVGNWTVYFTKNIGDYLGDVTIQAAPMSGFLQIKKAAAKYTEGQLKVIWEATGVKDDYCKVQIYARNGSNDILLYSGNTLDDNVRTVDMVDIDAAKIAGNIYDIIIKVTDVDVSAGTPKKYTYQFITDEYTIKNVEVPNL